MREKRKRPIPAATIISKMARRHKFHDKIILSHIFNKWESILGTAAAPHTSPVELNRGRLVICVDHPTWMQELAFLKEQILKKLGQVVKTIPIKSIRFKLGELPPDLFRPKQNLQRQPSKPLAKDESEFVNRAVERIADLEVRKIVKRAMTRAFENKC